MLPLVNTNIAEVWVQAFLPQDCFVTCLLINNAHRINRERAVVQWNKSPPSGAAEGRTVHALQPEAAYEGLPIGVSDRLQQL